MLLTAYRFAAGAAHRLTATRCVHVGADGWHRSTPAPHLFNLLGFHRCGASRLLHHGLHLGSRQGLHRNRVGVDRRLRAPGKAVTTHETG